MMESWFCTCDTMCSQLTPLNSNRRSD